MQVISTSSPSAIPAAIQALGAGHLVIYPTETCYGIAADSCSSQAVSRLLTYKGDRHRQVSVAVSSKEMAQEFVVLNSMAANLYQQFLPGPITVISNSRGGVDPRLESTQGTLGVRYPAHNFALALIKEFGHPITATSANTSGRKEPYSLADWHRYTTKRKQAMVSLFLDAGRLVERPTSTVVDTTLNSPQVLRQGALILPAFHQSFLSHSESDTKRLARKLISRYLSLTRRFPLILALQGELGAGKTQFAGGVAAALGIKDSITSPTYTILKEYGWQLPKFAGTLYHLDTWRLSDLSELDTTLHLQEYLQPGNILVMEWAGKATDWLKRQEKNYPILVIDIKESDDHTRTINYAFTTPEWS